VLIEQHETIKERSVNYFTQELDHRCRLKLRE
jgi:hypothetical protein